jgi:hypothetical protein
MPSKFPKFCQQRRDTVSFRTALVRPSASRNCTGCALYPTVGQSRISHLLPPLIAVRLALEFGPDTLPVRR